jgi:hypothetical protein
MNTLTLRKIMEISRGLLKIEPKVRASDAYSLSLIYTPGVSTGYLLNLEGWTELPQDLGGSIKDLRLLHY